MRRLARIAWLSLSLGLGLGWLAGARAHPPATPLSATEAARFLTQATFGPTEEEVARVQALGMEAWTDRQIAMPLGETLVEMGHRQERLRGKRQFFHTFWNKALNAPDALRQRVAFALSEIFVVSLADACGANHGYAIDSYHDTLTRGAFGTYRQLLEDVTLHPLMGCYLSHLRNRREETSTGRVPDENFAREVMQLFSIGLVRLQPDGRPELNEQGLPTETYGPADVAGLARVFTGWSWACPEWPSDACFQHRGGAPRLTGGDPWTQPMVPYGKYHAWQEKRFLGVTIPAQNNPDPEGDLKVALDTLANHPNVGPFIGRQLIQRLVTSNPSPAYVERVATVFRASGGQLGAVVKAILLDPQAREMGPRQDPTFGKVREPVLRLSALLRAFHADSFTGEFLIGDTHQAANGLNQAPLRAPSVFNFFRPGHMPPNSLAQAHGLVAPEMQLTDETSMAGFARFMLGVVSQGLGEHSRHEPGQHPADVKLPSQGRHESPLHTLALTSPPELVEMINQRLLFGQMSETLAKIVTDSVAEVDVPQDTPAQAPARLTAANERLQRALFLVVNSPEFLVQR